MPKSSLLAGVIPLLFIGSQIAAGDSFPKVDADLAEYDAAIQEKNEAFAKVPVDAESKEWIAKKLEHMVDIDQYMRNFMDVMHTHQYTAEEQKYFFEKFFSRWRGLDGQNTADLKALLQKHSWFTISEFGKKCDSNAWLLVQHADEDPEFQKEVLAKLEKLSQSGETRPDNYAYLYDRVATSAHDPTKRRPQRYGTQGQCVAPGKWEPFPIEDPENVDARRAAVGLKPLSEYIAGFKDICK